MRVLKKSPREPRELVAFRAAVSADANTDRWDEFSDKSAVRRSLCEEQGALCCYCMGRIRPTRGMKVEHYAPRSVSPELSLQWQNLFGACMGGEGSERSQQTCDTRKADSELHLDPRRADHVASLRYLSDGTIRSDDHAIQRDLDETLNLNVASLKEARVAVLSELISALQRRLKSGKWSRRKLETELEHIRTQQPLREYAGVVEWWIDRQARRRHR